MSDELRYGVRITWNDGVVTWVSGVALERRRDRAIRMTAARATAEVLGWDRMVTAGFITRAEAVDLTIRD